MGAGILACWLGQALAQRAAGAEPDRNLLPATAYVQTVQPFLARYCRDCHGGDSPEAELDLAALDDKASLVAARPQWEKVLDQLRSGTMPPPDAEQPEQGLRETVAAWIDAQFKQQDCAGGPRAGRVTIRRLNRSEYNNTIRDLVGVDFRPADDFPADDTGYGFDNIGDVLSLPPLLLEKYLAAAEEITRRAIVVSDPRGKQHRYEAEALDYSTGSRFAGWAHNLFSNGEVAARHNFDQGGEYVLRVRAFGQQAGDEPARLALKLDGGEAGRFDVAAVELEPGVYEARLRVEAGQRRLAAAFINDYYRPNDPNPANRDRNLVIDYLEVEGPLNQPAELPESHRRIFFCQPGESDAETCGRKIIERFASRAFRRPAAADEVERLWQLARLAIDSGESFEQGIQLAVQAVLVSPHFLFRVEPDRPPDRPDGSYPLNDFELASRLSYFLWSSMPDEELFGLAQRGQLRQGDNLEAQVLRMLRDPRSQALVENFAGQWLELRNLARITPDPARFPEFDEALRQAMRQETELFFAAILREDRSLLDFLSADFTFVNERLARHYGMQGISGDEFQRVTLADGRRRGVLTQASVLAVTSNPTRTSPVKRGKWILENLLGTPPPPPPPNVPELAEGDKAELAGTLRQRMEQHSTNALCASCHSRMDPLGFGLENFDALGAWRVRDGAQEIDASGKLPSGESFQGPQELLAVLARKQDLFLRCLTEKMLTYALGRGLEPFDRCTVDAIQATLARHDHRASRLVLAIVASDPFQRREARETR